MKRAHGRQPGWKKPRAPPGNQTSRTKQELLGGADVEEGERGPSEGLGCCRHVHLLRCIVAVSVIVNILLSVKYFTVVHQLQAEDLASHTHTAAQAVAALSPQIVLATPTPLPPSPPAEKAKPKPPPHVVKNPALKGHVVKTKDGRTLVVRRDKLQKAVAIQDEIKNQETTGEKVTDVLVGNFQAPPLDACKPCNSQPYGRIPTTLSRRWPDVDDCTWIDRKGTYIHEHALGIHYGMTQLEAKELCLRVGHYCTGITCEADACTVRHGSRLHPSDTEDSLVKDCPDTNSLREACGRESGQDLDTWSGMRKKVASPDLQNTAIVVIAHDRDDDLRLCLASLGLQADLTLFDVFVSVDVPDGDYVMRNAVEEVSKAIRYPITTWLSEPLVNDGSLGDSADTKKWFNMSTAKIAHHYRVVFEKVFTELKYDYGIFIEEDLVLSPDFLALFRSTVWLLQQDPTLWCVSAWNDHGFKAPFSDQCRLTRTSYFPGLGFLLSKEAWDELGQIWSSAPTMGWDYWTRVAFRDFKKECIIPEIPRSHHNSTTGSSITKPKQFKLFKAMASATIPNTCSLKEPCRHFGDISYLQEQRYDEWLRETLRKHGEIHTAKEVTGRRVKIGMRREDATLVVPFLAEEYVKMLEVLGLQPKDTNNAIPQDVRAEHYGLLYAFHMPSQMNVIMVDRRSPRHWLPQREQHNPPEGMRVIAAPQQTHCAGACQQIGMGCKPAYMDFVNNCEMLKQHFPCEAGCAHQVGKELPAYVTDMDQPTRQQCLVTFISKMTCDGHHPSTARLCACV
mmetsp:Transcript_21667/g.50652  ORF Transcript_21667/g.50652 Transcript_21667/m.50652 type:complete len:791 (+) Transcript_21667:45-2417(+)